MTDKENHTIDELAAEFISEIQEDLNSLEPDLLAMEQKGSDVDADLINHAFRAIHSIKGGAGFINYHELARIANAMENVFMHVREGKLRITSEIVDALLAGFDKMKLLVDSIYSNQSIDISVEKQKLEEVLLERVSEKTISHPNPRQESQEPAESVQNVIPEYEFLLADEKNEVFKGRRFQVEKKILDRVIEQQKFIFAAFIQFETDLKEKNRQFSEILDDIRDIGMLLFSDENHPGSRERNNPSKTGNVCVIATILDKEFLAQVLEIDISRIARASIESGRQISIKTPDADSEPPIHAFPAQESVRINVNLISSLMNRAGELVLARNQLKPYVQDLLPRNHLLESMLQNLDMVTTQIQESVMQMRMQPISDLLGKYKRVVRDIARKLSKEVAYSFTGGDVELDRTVLENLANPFIHLIRNSVDHGIETMDQRLLTGKSRTGHIQIHVSHLGGQVHINISDDGAGIDADNIADKAVEKGLITIHQREGLNEKEKINLIFLPGFSMSDDITEISGRGVGLDVVKTNIAKLNGTVDIEASPGKGTTIRLVIPLTLAIVPTLIIECGQSRFAVPQVSIKEVLFVEPEQICSKVENIGESEVLRVRDQFVPVIRLRNILGIETYVEDPATGETLKERRKRIADRRGRTNSPDSGEKRSWGSDRRRRYWDSTYIIILKLGLDLFGLCVDEVFDIEEIVVEPLSDPIKQCRCFSGATILGNGRIIMILDVPGIARAANLQFEAVKRITQGDGRQEPVIMPARELLVFSSATNEFFALQLDQISRLEAISTSEVHRSGQQKCMGREKMLFPVFSLDEFLPVTPFDDNPSEEIYLIIPKHPGMRVGILASKIIDTFQTEQEYQTDGIQAKGVAGKILLDNMMVQVLDIETILNLIEQKAV